ncbi:putative xaa-Pro aminopeptidase family enzyme [Colletotrichum sublineola]|uniref:Putative xaa-Pro aminopeptidase family enzyme n=1 Tax=Colletotrichum sublineola TaxID=1173701 RepID=A0A066X3Q8_COLSU|nr:putative xaa-Pro aminopeptidase family enzyme [Colletotrichum sublineola]
MHWLTTALIPAAALLWGPVAGDPTPKYNPLPPLREQARIQDAWTAERKAGIPALLKRHGVDAWVVSQREYAEETVFWSFKPASTFSARRRTTCLFLAEPLALESPGANSSEGSLPRQPGCIVGWTTDVWETLKAQLDAADPATVAVDAHPEIAFASGLHAGEYQAMANGLGGTWTSRMVVKPEIAVEFIATQPRSKLPRYREVMETAWAMIARGFSEAVVVPGKTTTGDLEWWFREEILAHNFTTWFQPSVSVVDQTLPWDAAMEMETSAGEGAGGRVIEYGDMLHVDFGLTAMGLNTDTQHLGYVLRPGEKDVPQGLKDGLKKGNKLQDIVRRNIAVGKTGNEMLKASLGEMHAEGIQGRVYTHPIGDWGHSAGPLIGMTNMQDYVPASGELVAVRNMWFSVELLVEHYVPERNQTLWFALEEDVYWAGEEKGWQWVYGRQEEFHLVEAVTKPETMEEL